MCGALRQTGLVGLCKPRRVLVNATGHSNTSLQGSPHWGEGPALLRVSVHHNRRVPILRGVHVLQPFLGCVRSFTGLWQPKYGAHAAVQKRARLTPLA